MKKFLRLFFLVHVIHVFFQTVSFTSDKEKNILSKKLKAIQKQQLQSLKNFTPGFKTALSDFFAYDWTKAEKNARKKETKKEIEKIVVRLEQGYSNLKLDELINQLKQIGNSTAVTKSNQETKQHLIDLLEELRAAEGNIYTTIKHYEKKVEPILGGLLIFSALDPAPYTVWSKIKDEAEKDHKIIIQFISVVEPLVKRNTNKDSIQKHFRYAEDNLLHLKNDYTDYKKTVDLLLTKLLKDPQKVDLNKVLNSLELIKIRIEKTLKILCNELKALSVYVPFIADDQAKEWQKLINDMQKLVDEITKNSEEFQKRFNTLVSQHQVVFEIVSSNNRKHWITKNLIFDKPLLTNLSSVIQGLQTSLVSS